MPPRMRSLNRLALCTVAAGAIAIAPHVRAQDAAPPADESVEARLAPADAPAAPPAPSEGESIAAMIRDSGPTGLAFMAVLGLFSLVGATVALERAVNTRRSRIIPAGFLDELQQLLASGDSRPESFAALCARWTAPISSILSAGLLRCGRPLVEVEKSMEDAATREMAALRGGVRPLSVVGTIAPLVGLLGTVLGMIVAFRTASQAGLGKGELMAQGIYMALLTTAAGLTIAIPALLLAALFNARIEKYFREIDEHLMRTMPCFARMEGKIEDRG